MTPEFISGACYFIVQLGLFAMSWWLFGDVASLKSELDLHKRTIRRLRRKVSEHDDLIDELESFTDQFEPTEMYEENDDADYWKQQ